MQVITTLIGSGNRLLEPHNRLPRPPDVRPTKNSVLAQRLQVAHADRDEAIRRSKHALSRRRVAELTGMTPGRVQQIIDRESR